MGPECEYRAKLSKKSAPISFELKTKRFHVTEVSSNTVLLVQNRQCYNEMALLLKKTKTIWHLGVTFFAYVQTKNMFTRLAGTQLNQWKRQHWETLQLLRSESLKCLQQKHMKTTDKNFQHRKISWVLNSWSLMVFRYDCQQKKIAWMMTSARGIFSKKISLLKYCHQL